MFVDLCSLCSRGPSSSSAWALLWLVAFALYISRFQIAPGELAFSKLFGIEYAS